MGGRERHEGGKAGPHRGHAGPLAFQRSARVDAMWIAQKRYAINIFVGDHIIIPLEAILPSPFEFFSCLRRLDSLGNF